MHRRFLVLTCAMFIPLATLLYAPLSASAAPSTAARCSAAGYSKSLVKCQIVPSHGTFSISISHSKIKLTGSGSPSTSGTQITVIRVPGPVASQGGFGIRVRATGKFKALHLTKGKLFRYHPAQNNLGRVKAVTSPGVFQVV